MTTEKIGKKIGQKETKLDGTDLGSVSGARKKKILFYYLSAFSNTGGIEKFNRCFIKALTDIASDGFIDPSIVSVYDIQADEKYVKASFFKGFGKRRIQSLKYVILEAYKNDILIIGHINLSIAGWLVKLLRPKCQIYVVAHGIEVWKKMFFFKRWNITKADKVLCVSNYTKNQLVLRNSVDPGKMSLFPNTIDPYFDFPSSFEKPPYLLKRYGLDVHQPVILTLSRLVSSEKYKGYDKVIAALPMILKSFPNAIYILAGKYDEAEKVRVKDLVEQYKVAKHVLLTGFLKDEEVSNHYCLADVFIMPSRKEGFGIVFLEAMACGSQVIGGNQDGTVDALVNGAFGRLINPTKISEISSTVCELLSAQTSHPLTLQKDILKQYKFDVFKNRLASYIIRP